MYLVNSHYLHIRYGVAVAAYIQLASWSQAKNFKTKEFCIYFRLQCAATPAQTLQSSVRSSLDSRRATSSKRPLLCGGRVPGHCYSMPYMKILAINQVIFIKHVEQWLHTDRVGYGGGRRCPGSTACWATTTGPNVDIPSAMLAISRRYQFWISTSFRQLPSNVPLTLGWPTKSPHVYRFEGW